MFSLPSRSELSFSDLFLSFSSGIAKVVPRTFATEGENVGFRKIRNYASELKKKLF